MSTEMWIAVVVAGVLVLATLVLAVTLLVRLVRARRTLRAAGLPLEGRAAFWASVLYMVSPVDLLPDPILLDDIGVLLLGLRILHQAAAKSAEPLPASDERRSSPRPRDPHLG